MANTKKPCQCSPSAFVSVLILIVLPLAYRWRQTFFRRRGGRAFVCVKAVVGFESTRFEPHTS
jgi:hypothetical protein